MTRFSDHIGDAFGEVAEQRIYKWFKIEVQPDEETTDALQQRIADSEQLINRAQEENQSNIEWNTDAFLATAKRTIILRLSEINSYVPDDLQRLWTRFGPQKPWPQAWVIAGTFGDAQMGIAQDLVNWCTVEGTLPELVAAMSHTHM